MSSAGVALTRRLGYRGGAALPLLAGAGAMTAGLALEGPLRAAVELPLALLLPGAAILVAARGARPARPASDVGLALVLSFATWMAIALGCHILQQLYTTTAVIVGADLVVVACAAICLLRGTPLTTLTGSAAGRVPGAQLLAYALAVVAVIGIVAVATRSGPPPAPYAGPYTEIALAGPWASVRSAVAVTGGSGPVSVELSVANHTDSVKTYEVVPVMRGSRWEPQTFALEPGASWRGVVRGTVPAGGCLHRLLVTVGEAGASKTTGSVTLWFQNGKKLSGKCLR